MKWDKIKEKFLLFLEEHNINSFDSFIKNMSDLSKDKKGDYFEYFCKLYFELETITKTKYKNFLLYEEIPLKLKAQLKLPSKDKGIDGIVQDADAKNKDKYYAVQCKFRRHYKKSIPFGELATFPALTFGTEVKVSGGIFFSNCVEVCDELQNEKYANILFSSLDEKCDKLFWINVREYMISNAITRYQLKKPLPHQEKIIPFAKRHYAKNNNGKLFLACGTGKTFLGYWIATRTLKCDKIFVVVPSLDLLSQTYEAWMKELQYDNPKEKYNFILIGSDMEVGNSLLSEYRPTTNPDDIKDALESYDRVIVITTYHSSDLLVKCCKKLKYKFDFGIYDEAHRTVGVQDKCFTRLIGSKIEKKRLFMTATEKIYSYDPSKKTTEEVEKVLSMDDESIYGSVIYRYSMRQAIEDLILVDYHIIAPYINCRDYDEKLLNNQFVGSNGKNDDSDNEITYSLKVILTGIMIITNMVKYGFRHLLIFSNTNERAEQITDFINQYIKKIKHPLADKLKCKFLSGHDSMDRRRSEVRDFEKSEYGIISSARIFGEGVDIKVCDAVCFADNKSSSIDIVQYIGRCLRKCEAIPNKISYVLVPCIVEDKDEFFDYGSESYLKLRKILKTIGTTDDMVTEKFALSNHDNLVKHDDRDGQDCEVADKKTIIDTDEFTRSILSKVFDKSGSEIDATRNMLISENKKRYSENDKLLDTKNKITDYLIQRKVSEPRNIKNWVQYGLGEGLFKIIRSKFYCREETVMACKKAMISDFSDYKNKHTKDSKLPPPNYLDDGFYYEKTCQTFNLNILLQKNVYSEF
jgi:predicted helicase